MAIVGSTLVRRDIAFVEQVARVLNYSHMLLEEYCLPFLKRKTKDIVQEMMLSELLHRMSDSTNRRDVRAGKVTPRNLGLLDVVKELN